MGSLNTKMIAFSLRTFYRCCSLLISVNGESYMHKSAIKRPIKILTHHTVLKRLTATVTEKKIKNCTIFISLHSLCFGDCSSLRYFYH